MTGASRWAAGRIRAARTCRAAGTIRNTGATRRAAGNAPRVIHAGSRTVRDIGATGAVSNAGTGSGTVGNIPATGIRSRTVGNTRGAGTSRRAVGSIRRAGGRTIGAGRWATGECGRAAGDAGSADGAGRRFVAAGSLVAGIGPWGLRRALVRAGSVGGRCWGFAVRGRASAGG